MRIAIRLIIGLVVLVASFATGSRVRQKRDPLNKLRKAGL